MVYGSGVGFRVHLWYSVPKRPSAKIDSYKQEIDLILAPSILDPES